MKWLRLVASLKLCVSVADCSLFYRAFLQKIPVILRSLRIVATPYDVTCDIGVWYDMWLLWVSCAECSLFYRAFLQKRPIILCVRDITRSRNLHYHVPLSFVGHKPFLRPRLMTICPPPPEKKITNTHMQHSRILGATTSHPIPLTPPTHTRTHASPCEVV